MIKDVVGRLVAGGLCLVALVGCSRGPEGQFEDGSAEFTVTYRPASGAGPVSVEVTMDGTDCFGFGEVTSFGADASPQARARHLEARVEEPTVNVGLYPGDVSGTWNAERPDSELWIVLPDGYLYRSRNDFEMVGDAVEVAGHVGVVGRGAGGLIVESVDEFAEATGTFTCGTVTR